MWITTIKNKNRTSDFIQVDVEFKNGVGTKYEKAFFVTNLEDLKRQIQTEISKQGDLDVFDASIAKGVIDSTPVTVAPTQDDLDREAFLLQYEDLKAMKRAINNGLLQEDDVDYVALQAEVKAAYKEDYTEII